MNELILSPEKECELVENMLNILSKECEFKLSPNLSAAEKRWFLNSLMCVRSVGEIDDNFLLMQNKLLTSEMERRHIVDAGDLKAKRGVVATDVPPTQIRADALVTLSNSLLFGSSGTVKDLDSQILLSGGLQINEEISNIYKEESCVNNYSSPYIVGGFNLPVRFVAKLLVPYIAGELNKGIITKLKNNISNLVDAIKQKGFKTVVVNLVSAPNNCNHLLTVLENELINLIKNKKVKTKLIFYKK